MPYGSHGSVTALSCQYAATAMRRPSPSPTRPGIPTGQLESVFARFERGELPPPEGEDTYKGHSFGLGLSIVRAVVEGHGGRVTAEPAAGLGGTAVTMWLPLCESSALERADGQVPEDVRLPVGARSSLPALGPSTSAQSRQLSHQRVRKPYGMS